jgi:hypothetical protein
MRRFGLTTTSFWHDLLPARCYRQQSRAGLLAKAGLQELYIRRATTDFDSLADCEKAGCRG